VTMAVPCWSSWKTGMSRLARSRSSTSKQRGAAMSSRLIPPKVGASRSTASTSSSVDETRRHTGKASIPANSLNSSALPSITGRAASGPISPRPRTAVPSVTTATVFRLRVSSNARAGFSAMAVQILATPGVYAIARSSLVASGTFDRSSSFPPSCMANVRSVTSRTRAPSTPITAAVTADMCSTSAQWTTRSTGTRPSAAACWWASMPSMLPWTDSMAVTSRARFPATGASSTQKPSE